MGPSISMSRIPSAINLLLQPDSYRRFIERGQQLAAACGLEWQVPFDEHGKIRRDEDWDLRKFTTNNERHASRLTTFSIVVEARSRAIDAGWPEALLPDGFVLGETIRDFLKAMAAHRASEGIMPRSVRSEISMLRNFFSTTNKLPWQLSSDDLDRYSQLVPKNTHVSVTITMLSKVLNENMLSLNVPIHFEGAKEVRASLSKMLVERKGAKKLPNFDALHEMVRIVFQESPQGHQHTIRFGIARLLTLTGLRLNEITLLPEDCLRWEEHIDIVTGRAAGEVGGVSRSLRLRYFGEKRQKKGDKVLVEDFQVVPERFEELVVSTVSTIIEATKPIREALASQGGGGRTFKTAAGIDLNVANFLFLVLHGKQGELPDIIGADSIVEMAAPSSFMAFLGEKKENNKDTLFTKYSRLPNKDELSIKSHSLRHLMNTELFRQGVPDTVITQHFGRQSVAQSYEYDHRSLAERLNEIEIPKSARALIKPGTPQETVARMVLSDFFGGSAIAIAFKKIQSENGDEAAFLYLANNSDGFHVTPYGFCITSFAVNPCIKHLKCFDNCRHFMPSGIKEHRVSLESLRANLRVMRDTAAAKPLTSTGRKNQILHAEQLILGVDQALAAQPNEPLFPNGSDHSAPAKDLFK